MMKDDEQRIGFRPVESAEWLNAADWHDGFVISFNKPTVRIVAIMARAPGTGAFSRLIDGIVLAGLTPVVVAPMMLMPSILKRWGWKEQIRGSGLDREDSWRPTKEWIANRAALRSQGEK